MERSKEIERVLIDEGEIAERLGEVAAQIDADYKGKVPIVICILKGSLIFCADLIRAMEVPVTLEFMKVSSYGASTTSSGKLSVSLDILSNIEGKDVLIVEDIIDSGHTMKALTDMLQTRRPASLRIVTLLDKPSRRVVEFDADLSLFTIPDHFVIGYGLDCGELYRNLPYIAEYEENK